MSFDPVIHFRRVARTPYSRHPAALLFRLWCYFAIDPSGREQYSAADILVLPLAGLALTLWVLGTVPGASDAVSMACSTACMP